MTSKVPTVVALALLLAACAGPGARDDGAAARRADAERQLERECRMAYRERRDDPRCPAHLRPDDTRSRGIPGAPLPPPPDPPALPRTY